MKKSTIIVRKWTARVLVAVGALLGLVSCNRHSSISAVYGPSPEYYDYIRSQQAVKSQQMAIPDTTKTESVKSETNKNEDSQQ
jgi:hypothetical protein